MKDFIQSLWDMMFGQQDPVGMAVNVIIAALFIIGVIDVSYSLFKLFRERGFIGKAKALLSDKKASAGLNDFRSRSPADIADAVLKFLDLPANSLIERRVARVIRLRSAGLGQRDVLQQLSAEHVEGYGSLSRYLGVTLTLLGLLGTVFGLSIALLKIQGALEGVNDVEGLGELTRALGGTLQGMKTAFGCTLAGLSTAILLSFLNHMTRRNQSNVIIALEEFIVCDLLPTLEGVDPGADEAAKAFANVMKTAGTDLENVSKSVVTAAGQFEAGSAALAAVAETMKQTVLSFSTSASQIAGNQQAFTQSLTEIKGALAAMTDASAKQLHGVQEFTANNNRILEARLDTMAKTSEVNENVLRDIKTIAEQFNPAIREYHEHFRGFVNAAQAEFSTSLKSLLTEINNHYREAVTGHIDDNRKGLHESLEQHLVKLQGIVEQNRTGVSSLLEKHQVSLKAFSDMVVDFDERIRNLFDTLDPASNGWSERAALSMSKEA